MGIGKSKHTQMDIDGLMNEIDAEHQTEQESAAVKERLEELRAAKTTLQEAAESLELATAALNEAVAALHAAKDSADNIVPALQGNCRCTRKHEVQGTNRTGGLGTDDEPLTSGIKDGRDTDGAAPYRTTSKHGRTRA